MSELAPWRQDLRPLFAPRSVAIVGASERNFVARSVQEGLRAFGFEGAIHPVNPRSETVLGERCYPSLRDLPERVDLAVIVVNAAAAVEAVAECGAVGIPAALVMATGFAEAGPDGVTLMRRLAAAADEHRIRLCGPGTFGLVSVAERVAAYIAPVPVTLRPGPVAAVTQSGSLVNMILTLGDERRLGFTHAVSAGSEATLGIADYLSYFLADERTRVIAVVAEQLRDPQAFTAVAERAAELDKPIVMLKLGRSEAARRASLAHTGALVGSADVHDAAFRHLGVRSVRNLDEFIETTALLARSRRPAGRGVGVISVSGGDCVLATDIAARAGLDLPQLADATVAELRAVLPEVGLATNPVDTGMRPIFERGLFDRVVRAVAADPRVDLVAARLPPAAAAFREIGEAARAQGKPVIAFSRATQAIAPELWLMSEELGVPIAQEVEKSFVAIRHLIDHAAFQRGRSAPRAQRRTARPPASRWSPGPLGPLESAALLDHYGLRVAAQTLARSEAEAVAAAKALGPRVAAKLVSPDVLHKTERGAVRLGLAGATAVGAAFRELASIATEAGARFEGVLVQAMAEPGTELLLGMLRDPEFGPVVVCGLGGTAVEAFADRALRIPPVDAEEAAEMLAETVADRVLRGARGGAADREAFIDALVRFSELCADVGASLEAIDLNPVIVHGAGKGATVVDARIIVGA